MKELSIELTNRCQKQCDWCSASYEHYNELDIDVETVKHILEKEKLKGFTHVRFTGGEPRLYKYLDDVIDFANQLGYHITLLTNGINKYFNKNISSYQVHWNKDIEDTLTWLKYDMKTNVIINVVNILEADILGAIKFGMENDIEVHIMKLQYSGRAFINRDKFHEIKLSMSGEHGCNRENKKLILVNGKELQCTSDKSKIGCTLCGVRNDL